MKVTKRDGSIENFSQTAIKSAIREAFKSTRAKYPKESSNLKCTKETLQAIINSLDLYESIPVEEIQNQIENSLIIHDFKTVAKEYILYRNKKKEIREWVKNKKNFIEKYKNSSNTANATVDDNSNVASKNIGVLNAEIHKEDNILVSRAMIIDKIKQINPEFKAKQYEKDLKSHIIYKHDESSFAGAIAPYCCSITMYPFLNTGLEKIGGLSAHPQNLDSFCGMYINLIFAASAQFAGAVATSEFLLYFDYFAKKEFGEDYYLRSNEFCNVGPKYRKLLRDSHYWCSTIDELKNHDFGSEELNLLRDELVYNSTRPLSTEELQKFEDELSKFNKDDVYKFSNPIKIGDGTRTIGSCIQQYFQQVIYSINQPAAARGLQSAFVNFSYFDKPFFEGMFGDFVFPDENYTKPQWESLSWLQKDFMIWFNKERTKTIITFPVESFALVYQNGKFLDEDSFNFVVDEFARGHSFFVYISDTVDSLSSCCFEGKTPVMYVKPEDIKNNGGEGSYTSESIEDAYNKYYDQTVLVYHEDLHPEEGTCIGSWKEAEFVKAQAIQEVQIYLVPDSIETLEWRNIMRVTPDHIFPILTENGIVDKHAYLLQTGDKLVLEKTQYEKGDTEMVVQDEQPIMYRSIAKVNIVDLEEPKDYYCFRIKDEKLTPYFLLPNGVITHNCFNGTEFMNLYENGKIVNTLTVKEFVENYKDTVEYSNFGNEIHDGKYIKSFDIHGNEKETEIIGILKKKYTGKMYTFTVDGKSIQVTADHLLMVKNIKTGEIDEVPAEEVAKYQDLYLIATEN